MNKLKASKFKIVQNKLHFAITGKTATELIIERVDSSKPHTFSVFLLKYCCRTNRNMLEFKQL